MSSPTDPARAGSGAPAKAALPPAVCRWIRTECGRAKYLQLAARPGPLARLRLAWFVLIAALRDLPLALRGPWQG